MIYSESLTYENALRCVLEDPTQDNIDKQTLD